MHIQKITDYLDSLVARDIPSVDCIIYKNHEQIYRHMQGTTDANKTIPIKGDERYLIFSMTKVQTMTAVLQLVEKGKLSLEDEVSKYLPAYKNLRVEQDGKILPLEKPLRLWHLLSMQSGLDYDLDRPGVSRVLAEKGEMATTRELVDTFMETPLHFVPGEHFMYSLSHDVAAAIVELVSGMRFSEYLRKNIWEPLQLKNTFFAKPMNESLERLSTQFVCNEQGIVPMQASCEYQLSENYESGGAGLVSATEDYAVFGDALACGGTSKYGTQLLQPQTIDLMRTNLLGPVSRAEIRQNMGRVGYGYGCGVQILLEPEELKSPAPKGVFGWDGAAGSCLIMDPSSGLSLIYMQHVRNCGISYAEFHPRLRDLLFEK